MGAHPIRHFCPGPRYQYTKFFARPEGFSFLELLFVVAVLGFSLLIGLVTLSHGLRSQEARGAAQDWQAAASWAQIGVLWQGGSADVSYLPGSLALAHDLGLIGGGLGASAPTVSVRTNLARWRDGDGAVVSFSGTFASPDGGGSLFFDAHQGSYRVVIRPESGITTRTKIETQP